MDRRGQGQEEEMTTRIDFWKPVPHLEKYEFETHAADYGGTIIRVRLKGTPTLLAAQHVHDDKWPSVAAGIARCVARIEEVA